MSVEFELISPEQMLGELAMVLRTLGPFAPHLVLVGGLAPQFLVEQPRTRLRPTPDIDLCLALALLDGEQVPDGPSLEQRLGELFEMRSAGQRFRWYKRAGAPGIRSAYIDFLAPAGEDREPGLHAAIADRRVRAALGNLSPYTLPVRSVIELDARTATRTVRAPDRDADETLALRHVGPLGYLAAKAYALSSRRADKDAFDIAWLCLNVADVDAFAGELAALPAFACPEIPEVLEIVGGVFSSPDRQGPRGYASQLARRDGDDPGRREADRIDAAHAVGRLVRALRARLPEDA